VLRRRRLRLEVDELAFPGGDDVEVAFYFARAGPDAGRDLEPEPLA